MPLTPTLSRPKTILWDMDGTLVDQTAAIIRAYGDVIESMGGGIPDPDVIRRSLGGPMASTMALFIDDAGLGEAAKRFRLRFPEIMFDGLIVLPGGLELIESANKAHIAQVIFTNKHGDTARKVSEYAGFSKYIPICIGNTDTDWHKPQVKLTRYVLDQINASAVGACMIGDSPTDIETARNAGLPCYGIATGAHSTDEMLAAGAEASFNSLVELKTAFGL
ncbi:MAG: HAD family hydrolase [Opitutae bacterium]|jgi:phosphoglycolate phosphatase-like HAD superfamily hydrolase|nr:HAD family hydrolase [Opitutae bacterium]